MAVCSSISLPSRLLSDALRSLCAALSACGVALSSPHLWLMRRQTFLSLSRTPRHYSISFRSSCIAAVAFYLHLFPLAAQVSSLT